MRRAHRNKPNWKDGYNKRKAEKAATAGPLPEVMERREDKRFGRTVYQLSQSVRMEIHKHVRDGGELTALHTAVLALTDHLVNRRES